MSLNETGRCAEAIDAARGANAEFDANTVELAGLQVAVLAQLAPDGAVFERVEIVQLLDGAEMALGMRGKLLMQPARARLGGAHTEDDDAHAVPPRRSSLNAMIHRSTSATPGMIARRAT